MKEHSEPRCVNLTTERLLSRSERTPPWVKNIQVHEVNGPHHGLKFYMSPERGRTPPWVKFIPVHGVDGPNQGRTYTNPKNGRTQTVREIMQVHHVGSHQGSRPLSKE